MAIQVWEMGRERANKQAKNECECESIVHNCLRAQMELSNLKWWWFFIFICFNLTMFFSSSRERDRETKETKKEMTHLNHYYDDLLHWTVFVRNGIACSVELQITRLTHCDNWFVNVFVISFLFAAAFVLPIPKSKATFFKSGDKPTAMQKPAKQNKIGNHQERWFALKTGRSECGIREKKKNAGWTSTKRYRSRWFNISNLLSFETQKKKRKKSSTCNRRNATFSLLFFNSFVVMWNDNYLHETTLNLLAVHCTKRETHITLNAHRVTYEDDGLKSNWLEQLAMCAQFLSVCAQKTTKCGRVRVVDCR